MRKVFSTMIYIWIQLLLLLCLSASYIRGQNPNCDSLRRCQQRLSTIIQDTQSYSGISSGYQSDQQTKCRTVREDLDCLLAYAHQCQYGPYSAHNSDQNIPDLIRRTKTYLDSTCDRGGGWRSSQCYQRDDVRQCEVQYSNQYTTVVTNSSCRNYQTYRNCVMNAISHNCNAEDIKLMGTYFIDKAQEHSWKCSPNSSMDGGGNYQPYNTGNSNYNNNNLGGYSSGNNYNTYGQSYQRCDESQLRSCQQRIQSSAQDHQSQGSSSNWQNNQMSNCNNMRADLECMLTYVPLCQTSSQSSYSGSQSSYSGSHSSSSSSSYGNYNNADLIRRAKSYLDSVCDRGGGWRSSGCFRRSEITECEKQFNTQYSSHVSDSSCRNYNSFKSCVSNIIRHSCSSHDQQLLSAYLIDRGQEHAWSCAANTDYNNQGRYGNTYPLDRDRDRQTGYNYNQAGYGQNYGNQQQYGYNNDRYNPNYNPNYERYGSQSPGTDHCMQRVQHYTNVCEEQLHQRQRDARDSQHHNERQERICCSLYLYRDCLSRVIMDRCSDPNPIVVDILMGARKRDLTDQCRHIERHQCSGSQSVKQSLGIMFTCFAIVVLFFVNK